MSKMLASPQKPQRPSAVVPVIVGGGLIAGELLVIILLASQVAGNTTPALTVALVISIVLFILVMTILVLGFFVLRPMFAENEQLFMEMQAAQAQLQQSEFIYKTIVEDQHDLILRMTPDGQLNFVNDALCMYLRRDRDSLLSMNLRDFLPPKDIKRFDNYLNSLSSERPLRNIVYRLEPKSGHIIWQQWRIRALYDEAGNLTVYQAIGQDITEQKAAEDTVLRTTARLQFLLSASPAVIYTTEAKDNFNPRFVSRNVETMFGHQQVDYWTVDRFWISRVHPDDIDKILEQRHHLTVDVPVAQDYRFQRGDGHYIWIRDEYRLTTDEAGNDVIIGAWVDISDRKADEEAIRDARDAALSANRAKSSFLATMSHELRTPLNAILGFTQLILVEDDLPTTTRQHMETIGRSGQHLLQLINDILEMSRIEAGRVTLHQNAFNIRKLLHDIEDMFKLKAQERSLELRFIGIEKLPQAVKADEGKLRQIFINLINNAIKFTKAGHVEIRVKYAQISSESDDHKGRLMVDIEDTGQGIADEEMAVLFRPFAQTGSGRRLQEGTGLGLAITREFVRLMNGDIMVTSEQGVGSTFSFEITVTETLSAFIDFQPDTDTQVTIRIAPDQQHYRILVVEDEEDNRELLLKTLKLAGFQLAEAHNGEEGIRITEEWQPDLIFMDMSMPIMDGITATQHIRQQGNKVPIIAFSANVFERQKFLDAGCDDIIIKPFNRPLLFLKLQEHLGVNYDTKQRVPDAPRAKHLDTGQLVGIPTYYIDQLREAATKLDFQEAQAISSEIRKLRPEVADSLDRMISEFRFDLIQILIEQFTKLNE